jgi:hypothetical protein
MFLVCWAVKRVLLNTNYICLKPFVSTTLMSNGRFRPIFGKNLCRKYIRTCHEHIACHDNQMAQKLWLLVSRGMHCTITRKKKSRFKFSSLSKPRMSCRLKNYCQTLLCLSLLGKRVKYATSRNSTHEPKLHLLHYWRTLFLKHELFLSKTTSFISMLAAPW